MADALVITDVQNDFCPGGALPVDYGDRVIPVINKLSPRFHRVVATQDWHPLNHVSFAKTHHRNPGEVITAGGIEQVLWPVHCVSGTFGAELHKDLNLEHADLILRKGTDPLIDSYSVFLENDKRTETGLRYYLKGLRIDTVYICGLTLDYCVYFSAIDARRFGFNACVITDACKGLDSPKGNVQKAINDMVDKGVRLVDHEHI
ncbi:MAG: bifunctional nicotinamidase/pyrazinamidase [Endomicrobiales bacterium]